VKLFLMRHGEASFKAPSDIQRPLTERGIAQTKVIFDKYINEFGSIKIILASPYLRAQQTAKIASEALGISVTTMPSITPDGNPQRVCDSLFKSTEEASDRLLVTHMPFVGDLNSLLVSGDTSLPESFATSQIVMLEAEHVLVGCMTRKKVFLPY
jgi:phosphohistidine phosphatase